MSCIPVDGYTARVGRGKMTEDGEHPYRHVMINEFPGGEMGLITSGHSAEGLYKAPYYGMIITRPVIIYSYPSDITNKDRMLKDTEVLPDGPFRR